MYKDESFFVTAGYAKNYHSCRTGLRMSLLSSSRPDESDGVATKAEHLLASIFPTRIFLGQLLTPVCADGHIGEDDAAMLCQALEKNIGLWHNSIILSSLLVAVTMSYNHSIEAHIELDDATADLLRATFAILGAITMALLCSSLGLSYMLSNYASILTHADDMAWFFANAPVTLPNILNVVAMQCFILLVAVGTLLHNGIAWYSIVCAAIWLGTGARVLYFYSKLRRGLTNRWRSAWWLKSHPTVELDDERTSHPLSS